MRSIALAASILLGLVPAAPAFSQTFSSALVGSQIGWEETDISNRETALGNFARDADRQSATRGLFDLSTRAGFLLDPGTLAYLRGGQSFARLGTDLVTGTPRLSNESPNGWLVGAGIERQLLQRISGRLDYRYSDSDEGTGDHDRHRLLVGIAYRF